MTKQLVFDVRFKNSSGVGNAVDSDLRVEVYEEGESLPVITRYLGPDSNSAILQSSDAEGVLYTTTVDGASLSKGAVTVKWYAKIAGSVVNPYPFVEEQSNIDATNALSVGEIKSYIRSMLGFPVVTVELTPRHYSDIVDEALALYGQHIPAERVERLAFQASVQRYHLPHLPYNGPFDVKMVRKIITPVATDPIFGREYLRANEPDLGTMMIGQAYLKTALRVLSSEPDWRWLHESKELYVNIGPGISSQVYGGYDVTVRYFAPVSLEMVREDHFRWFKRYCLSQAKKVLAKIRGKYSGAVPAPGGPLVLDHESLMAEGAREEQELVDQLQQMAPHVPPMWG